jgi:hypothetical protein
MIDLPKLWDSGDGSAIPATFDMDQFDQSPMLVAGMSVLSPIGLDDDFM